MIKNMSKEKKLLMWSVMLIAMVQMPNLALSPSINVIYDTVFGRKWELGTIQTHLDSECVSYVCPWKEII